MKTKSRAIRFPDELWDAFGAAIEHTDPMMNRATVLKQFARWYLRRGPAPRFPEAKDLVRLGLLKEDDPWPGGYQPHVNTN